MITSAIILSSGIAKIIGIGREIVGRRLTGELFPMDLSVGKVAHSGGVKFVGIARDVTVRNQLVKSLQNREADLRMVVDNAPGGIFTTDTSGKILSANPTLTKLLQHGSSTLVGTALTDLTVANDRATVQAAVAMALANPKQPQFVDITCVRPGEKLAHVMVQLGLVSHVNESGLAIRPSRRSHAAIRSRGTRRSCSRPACPCEYANDAG